METFGRYELLRRLAVGGMAEIFLARSASIDGFEKTLVIKRIRSDLSDDAQFSSMFIDEARLSIGFSHPNIVQVFDFGKADDCYYLAMEYIAGCDLGGLLEVDGVRGVGLDPGLALLIMEEACKGLDYAHNTLDKDEKPLNIVHRDVSPANIMLSDHGAVKVADFGIAEATGRLTKTQPGMVVGKLSYMSPEHAAGRVVDRRTDVFSAGIVLWESLTGEPAYGTMVTDNYFKRIQEAQLKRPSEVRAGIPAELDDLLMRALARDKKDRYQTARDFGEELRRYRVRNYPDASGYQLEAFLATKREELREGREEGGGESSDNEVELPPTATIAAEAIGPAPRAPTADAMAMAADGDTATFDWSPGFVAAIESFRARPSLWTLVKMGKLCAKENETDAAATIYRAAAAKFAQAGLLAQALLCTKARLRYHDFDSIRAEISRLPLLHGATNAELASVLFQGEPGPVDTLLRELLGDSLSPPESRGAATPLLAYLGGDAFAELAKEARLRHFQESATIVEQGESSNAMYLIAEGRVLVYATGAEGQRIYLSSLTAGDFFGENAFFTGAPRSATVEALYHVDAFEIDQNLYDRVMQKNPQASNILLRFYKERIVETLLAKSPIFGRLPVDDRRSLVGKFELREFDAGAQVIQEGEISDQIYIIKHGEAEVFTEKGGPRTSLSTIGPGALFGEVAALRKVKRTASVVATSKLETLELSGQHFDEVLAAKPEIRAKVLDVVAQRARDNIDKVMGPSPFAGNMPR